MAAVAVAILMANTDINLVKDFLNKSQLYKIQRTLQVGVNFIYDQVNLRILGISANTQVLNKICDTNLTVDLYMHTTQCSLVNGFDNTRPYYYCVDPLEDTKITRTNDPLSDSELIRYALINEKVSALDYITGTVNNYRKRLHANTIYQTDIYEFKLREAKEILQSNINEVSDETEFQYPFVCGWAKIENLSLQTAAKEIKLRHEFVYTKLASIENLRLKFSKKVVEAEDITTIPLIVEEFICQGSLYGSF